MIEFEATYIHFETKVSFLDGYNFISMKFVNDIRSGGNRLKVVVLIEVKDKHLLAR